MKVVLIKWRDAHSSANVWTDPDEYAKNCEDLICESVGFEVATKKGYVALASSLSGHKQDDIRTSCKPSICIPTCDIISKRVLRK